MLTPEEAEARVLSGPITVGELRALIAAKADSADMGSVNPFAPLSEAAANYSDKLSGRADDEMLVVEEGSSRLLAGALMPGTLDHIAPAFTVMRRTPDFTLAAAILRDFG